MYRTHGGQEFVRDFRDCHSWQIRRSPQHSPIQLALLWSECLCVGRHRCAAMKLPSPDYSLADHRVWWCRARGARPHAVRLQAMLRSPSAVVIKVARIECAGCAAAGGAPESRIWPFSALLLWRSRVKPSCGAPTERDRLPLLTAIDDPEQSARPVIARLLLGLDFKTFGPESTCTTIGQAGAEEEW